MDKPWSTCDRRTMNIQKLGPLLLLSALTTLGCARSSGPRVHVASATRADLEAIQGADTVWYEFRPGDVVPFQFLLIGVAVSGTDPIELRATEHFWLVMSEDAPMRISFDGQTLAQNQAELLVAVVAGKDDRAQVVWLNYVGNGNAQAELEKLGNAEAATPSEPTPSDAAEPMDIDD